MEKMNFVIVGYGGMGGYHARELIGENDYVQTYGVYDIKEERREQARKDGFQTYDTLNDVLADDDVEAILIATPNDSHLEIAIKSLRAGKHVVCEKPVTMSVAELDDILAVAETTQRQFMVHQNRRWDNDFLIVREWYQQYMLGEVFQIESRVHGANGIPGDWRHLKEYGGGMLLDWGVHLLDQLLFLVDQPVKRVYSDLSYVLGDEVDDGFTAWLTFGNGVKAHVEVGTSNFVKLPRWYVKGYSGTGQINDWDLSGKIIVPNETTERVAPTPIKAGQGLTKTMAPPSEEMTKELPILEVEADFPEFYRNFYEVVHQNATPVVKNNEVRQVLVLIDAIFESAMTGKIIEMN